MRAAVVSVCLCIRVCGAWAGAADARRVLDATGVKGGLVVHLGCGEGRLTAALRAGDSYVVHGLDADASNIAAARRHVDSLELTGAVSAERFSGARLPYADNLVNLIVVEAPGKVGMDECLRVLVPDGVAYVRQAGGSARRGGDEGGWKKTVKPRPADIDEWTHFLHDAGGNAVARDTRVGPPRHLQWYAGPKRSRDHDSLASLSAMTSAGGRIFYIYDEGPTSQIHRRPEWRLIARDAFNGALLWKRHIPSWITHVYYFRSGPVWLGRRLVSTGGRVYATLDLAGCVSALDAATGRTVRTYEGSEKAEEILHHDGVLLVAVGDPELMNRQAHTVWAYWEYTVEGRPPNNRRVLAYEADTGKLLWKKSGKDIPYLLPLSLAAFGKRVFYMDSRHVRCVDLASGAERWRAPFETTGLFRRNYSPTVVAADGVLLCLTMDRLAAFDAEDGRKLWETKGYKGFASPGDLFVVDGLAWAVPVTSGVRVQKASVLGDGGQRLVGLDVRTGEAKKSFAKKQVWPGGHHHRCYRNKATTRYLVTGRRGLEFVDLRADQHVTNWWIRGECQYGIMPCNGMVYAPPDPCKCFNLTKVDGFNALVADNSLDGLKTTEDDRLTKGPAYAPGAKPPAAPTGGGKAGKMIYHPPARPADSDDWPTYRHDVTRSGSTRSAVAADVREKWAAKIGGSLTSPVVADGRLMTASIDRHTVYCLDADSGKRIWQFVAGGRVDSPPTITGPLAVFGCRDGYVYAVGASDGELAWRFRAADVDHRILVDGQLESAWPVHGSVLVLGEGSSEAGRSVAYFAAGRSSYLDGGIRLFGLDVATGHKLYETLVHSSPGPGVPTEEMTPALPDVLVSNGTSINMRQVLLDRTLTRQAARGIDTLIATTGLLEPTGAHRHNWALGRQGAIPYARHNGSLGYGPGNPFGKLIVFDADCAYAVQTPYTFLKHSQSMWPDGHRGHLHQKYATYRPEQFPTGVRLYAQDNKPLPSGKAAGAKGKRRGKAFTRTESHKWTADVPIQVRAMVLAGRTLFLAGRPDEVELFDQAPAAPARRPDSLWAFAADDGRKLAEHPLAAAPTFDGMIAARGRLYIATADGKVICLGRP